MSALRPAVIAAIVRKDILSLWPLILASLLMPLYAATEPLIELSPQVTTLVVGIGALATVVLTLTVIHQDATAGGRHDWMTRPIGLAGLSAAKAAFLGLTVVAPLFVATVANEIAGGHGWAEALLSGLSSLTLVLYVAIPAFVLGLVTGSLIQAGVIGLGLVILQILFSILLPRFGSDPGTRWIVDLMAGAAGLASCLAAVTVLVRTKRADRARLIWVGGAVVGMAIINLTPPSATIAIQQALFPGSKVTGPVVTSVVETCYEPSQIVDAPPLRGLVRARIAVQNLPRGWAMKVDNASAAYGMVGGATIEGPDAYADRFGGKRFPRSLSLFLLRPGDLKVSALAPQSTDIRTIRWTYDISLLQPAVSRDLPIDGRRRYLPGVGFCDASRGSSLGGVAVRCFKPFAQPATVGATIKGQPLEGCPECGGATYKPAILEGVGRSRNLWVSDVGAARSLTLTTYEARGHAARQSTTAGVPPLCPKPPADAER